MSKEITVVHVVHSLGVGGLENGVVNLVNRNAPGLRHTIICMTTDGPLRQRLHPGVDVFSLNKRPGHDLPTLLRLVHLLRHIAPEVVHSRNWATFDAALAARLAGVPTVVHGEHGRDSTDPLGQNSRRNRIRKLCAPLVSRFVAVSEQLHRWLVEDVRIAARKVVTIQNGVDTDRFAPADRAAARAALGLGMNQLVVGSVGRLDPVKDQVGLIHAFAQLLARWPRAVLVIAGDGPCRDELQALVTSLRLSGQVRLLGERHDIPVVLGALDVFVLPSIAEGISNTVLEAMATGLPIVATRVGGNPELVNDGENGRLVPSKDPSALSAAVATYLEYPRLRASHGQNSRLRAVEHFSLKRMSDEYCSLYHALTGHLTPRGRFGAGKKLAP